AYQSNSAITDIDVTFDGTWLTRGHSSQIGVGYVIDLLTGLSWILKLCRNAALNVNTQNLWFGRKFSRIFHVWYEGHISSCAINRVGSSCAMEQEAAFKLWQRSEDSGFLSIHDTIAALARGEVLGPHVKPVKTPLKETHLAKIMPIYQRLASNELLQRCIRCVTQNESLHSIIWDLSPNEISNRITAIYKRQREKSLDTRHRRLDDRYRVLPWTEDCTVVVCLHDALPLRCVPLTPAHQKRHSMWCREHRNWRDNEWGRVLFTDESRFSLSSDFHLERAGKPQSFLEHH
ncbi:uncharacterized protein TNCV_646991, partial [Trichonephila clavipes]